jgi:hypothetical protein
MSVLQSRFMGGVFADAAHLSSERWTASLGRPVVPPVYMTVVKPGAGVRSVGSPGRSRRCQPSRRVLKVGSTTTPATSALPINALSSLGPGSGGT